MWLKSRYSSESESRPRCLWVISNQGPRREKRSWGVPTKEVICQRWGFTHRVSAIGDELSASRSYFPQVIGSNLCVKRSETGRLPWPKTYAPSQCRCRFLPAPAQIVAVVHLCMEDHLYVGGIKYKNFRAHFGGIIYDLYDLLIPPGAARLSITQ